MVRRVIFRKPHMASEERILLYPYRKIKQFFRSKEEECLGTTHRFVKEFRLPLFDLMKEMLKYVLVNKQSCVVYS